MSRAIDDPAWMNYLRLVNLAALIFLIVGPDAMWQRAAAAVALWLHAGLYGVGASERARKEVRP